MMARRVMCYGGGGRPRPGDGRQVTVSCVCEACRGHVDFYDERCRHCGETLAGSVDQDDLEAEDGRVKERRYGLLESIVANGAALLPENRREDFDIEEDGSDE